MFDTNLPLNWSQNISVSVGGGGDVGVHVCARTFVCVGEAEEGENGEGE